MVPSLAAQKALKLLGHHLRQARRRRRLAIADLAARVGTSAQTIMRLERGEPGVGIGALAGVLQALGELDRLEGLLAPTTDSLGLMLRDEALPKRIWTRIRRAPAGPGTGETASGYAPVAGVVPQAGDIEPDGMAF